MAGDAGAFFQVAGVIVAVVGSGGILVTAMKLSWDGARHAGRTHDAAFNKGFEARSVELDGLRRSLEPRIQELEHELVRLRDALVQMVKLVAPEHTSAALEIMFSLNTKGDDHAETH